MIKYDATNILKIKKFYCEKYYFSQNLNLELTYLCLQHY